MDLRVDDLIALHNRERGEGLVVTKLVAPARAYQKHQHIAIMSQRIKSPGGHTNGESAALDVAVRSMAGRVAGRLVVALRHGGTIVGVDAVGEGALLASRTTDTLEVGHGPGSTLR